MNYYTFQTSDYAKCTPHLSLMEDLAYRRMLDLYYITELPLYLDPKRIAKRIGMIENLEDINYILTEYFAKTDKGWVNRRCEKEIEKYHNKVLRAKRAIKSRWSPSEIRGDINTDKIPTNNNINIKNKKKESIKKENSFDPYKFLTIQEKIEPRIVIDWRKLRQAKKAPITETVLKFTIREAKKANISLTQAIEVCIEKNWQNFNAEWYAKSLSNDTKGNPPLSKNHSEIKIVAWWNNKAGIIAKGKEMGKPMKPGENIKAYRARLFREGATK